MPPERRWEFFKELFNYRLNGIEPQPQSDLERMALVNIFPVIDRSVERYTANKENGQKGGRPRKWIPPEEWMQYYKEHGRKATAEHYGIPEETLKKWIASVGKKGKNQDIDIDKDIDIDTDIDSDIDTISNNKKDNNKNKESRKPVRAGSDPQILPCQPGYEFVNKGILYRFNDKQEVERIGPV